MAKLEGTEGECLLIPQKAFALIGSLRCGDVEIKNEKNNQILIKSGGTKTAFSTSDPESFPFTLSGTENDNDMTIDAEVLKSCFNHVLYAVSDTSDNQPMGCVFMKCADGYLNFVGLDGHMIAWDRIEFAGDFQLLIPKSTVSQLLSLDLVGKIQIEYNQNSAIFRSKDYVVQTRLVSGQYFQYDKMFGEPGMKYFVNRADMIQTLTRATFCMDATDKKPVTMQFGDDICHMHLQSASSNFEEDCPVIGRGNLEIGFNASLLLKTLKAFGEDDVTLGLNNNKAPMIVKAESSAIKALILPVAIRSSSNQ